MCGIFGVVGRYEPAALHRMAAALAHRGPDDAGLFQQAGVALGQARLSIIDLSPAGHQPMRSACGRYWIVYNGEIYNYRELANELSTAGVQFRGHSDTEVVLELYARHGAAMLPRLNGIFALAIWDSLHGELFLARDALGVKPLYIAADARRIAFASELKALLPVLPVRTLDPQAIRQYLSFLWCPGDATPLKEVRRLPPGQWLRVAQDLSQTRATWYELPARRGGASPALPADAEHTVHTAPAAVRQSLQTAVQRQLLADVPVGAFLSGGLDSSAVVALAREQTPGIECFTIQLQGGQDAGFADDLPYARRVAQHLDVRLNVVDVNAQRMLDDLPNLAWMLDEPLADPAPLNVLYICEQARRQGVKVLLSGNAGDDLFSGYRRHEALRYQRLLEQSPRWARRALQSFSERHGAGSALGRRAQRLLAHAEASGDAVLTSNFLWLTEPQLMALQGPLLQSEGGSGFAGVALPMQQFLDGVSPATPDLERLLALEQRFFLADHNLAYTDRMSMAAGVEVRVPFLDLELVDLAARVPADLKQRGRVGKWVLKKAMENDLPHDVIYRPKTGFGAPLRRWLDGALRPLMMDLLAPDRLRTRGLFAPAGVQALLTRHDAGRVDAAYTLFSMMMIELWCTRFIDDRTTLPT